MTRRRKKKDAFIWKCTIVIWAFTVWYVMKFHSACLITRWPNSDDTKWCCLVWALFCLSNFYNRTEFFLCILVPSITLNGASKSTDITGMYHLLIIFKAYWLSPWLEVKTATSGTAHASGAGKAKSPAFKTYSGAPYGVSSVDKWTSWGIWRVSTLSASSVNL